MTPVMLEQVSDAPGEANLLGDLMFLGGSWVIIL